MALLKEKKRYIITKRGEKHTLGDGCWGIRGLEDGGVYRIIIIGGLGGRRRREPEGEVLRGARGRREEPIKKLETFNSGAVRTEPPGA